MAKAVIPIECSECGELYRSKLKRGVPVRACPNCGHHNKVDVDH